MRIKPVLRFGGIIGHDAKVDRETRCHVNSFRDLMRYAERAELLSQSS